jgi:hypothetical protein
MKETAVKQLGDCGVSNINHDQRDGYVNSLKTMVNNKDAVLVSTGDAADLETVRRNLIAKKLGLEDKGMAAVHAVAEKMSGIHMKSRPAFY